MTETPTLYEWAGGTDAFVRLTEAFYARVTKDDLLAPLFARMEAFLGYIEWGTRLALQNSQPGADVYRTAPVPRWGWGVAPPYLG